MTNDVIDELVSAQDIVSHTLAEQSEQKELLERIFENTHTLIAYMDVEFNFIRANKAYYRQNLVRLVTERTEELQESMS